MSQDKRAEILFFSSHVENDAYDVFSPATNETIVDRFENLTGAEPGARVADLGCGSGVFTNLLGQRGFCIVGLDLCEGLVRRGGSLFPATPFVAGDVEALPFADNSIDAFMLSGLVHHLPDPSPLAAEIFRALKPGGTFFAFDPNRRNPFMYLYRDRSSPFYSNVGVTANERPVLAEEVAATFAEAGFAVQTDYLHRLRYRYVASGFARALLPIYHFIDDLLGAPWFMRPTRTFVLTYGAKPT